MMQARNLQEFTEFAKKMAARIPLSDKSYANRFGRGFAAVNGKAFTKEAITRIMNSGNIDEIRELSKWLLRYSGTYARIIQYYASLLNYGYMLVPHYDVEHPPKKLKQLYKKTAIYVKEMNFETMFAKISRAVLEEGIYFGLLKETQDGEPYLFQLPAKYCRTRFYDQHGLPIVELNVNYFNVITANSIEREQVLKLFPKSVQTRYHNHQGNTDFGWAELTIDDGAMCFYFNADFTPPFISACDAVADLENAREREKTREQNELDKILIQKLPIDKSNGELLFTLPEAAELHNSVCDMLADQENVDVITTYADITLEELQKSDDAASTSSNRLKKYKEQVFDEVGITSQIFNPESGSTAILYSIKKDINIMFNWAKQYELWVNCWLRQRAKNNQLYFQVKLLPTSTMFRKDDIDAYIKTAQYGYPKSALSAAMGMDMIDLVQLSDFENVQLDLRKSMVPLSSSYTFVEDEENGTGSEKKSTSSQSAKDLTNVGGRPTKDTEDLADRTIENQDGQ